MSARNLRAAADRIIRGSMFGRGMETAARSGAMMAEPIETFREYVGGGGGAQALQDVGDRMFGPAGQRAIEYAARGGERPESLFGLGEQGVRDAAMGAMIPAARGTGVLGTVARSAVKTGSEGPSAGMLSGIDRAENVLQQYEGMDPTSAFRQAIRDRQTDYSQPLADAEHYLWARHYASKSPWHAITGMGGPLVHSGYKVARRGLQGLGLMEPDPTESDPTLSQLVMGQRGAARGLLDYMGGMFE